MARSLGRTALLVVGGSGRGSQELQAELEGAGVRSTVFRVGGEPTVTLVNEAVAHARSHGSDLVIAVGGGSVIDAGKAVAVLLENPGDVLDYLEVVGGGKPLEYPGVPCIAVPTTAGTGAEVTRNSVLGVPEHAVKVSLRGAFLLPRLAVVDPALSDGLPAEITAYSGMDALTQLIEPLVSHAANPMTDALCREGLTRAARSLAAVYHDGHDAQAREDMALAALFSGMALANAKLGAVHGLAGVIGGLSGHPHGAICARLLPFVMKANLQALRASGHGENALRRYDEVARILTGHPDASADDGLHWVRERSLELNIPPLSAAGLEPSHCERIIPAAQRASSMKGNPTTLNDEQLREILDQAIHV
jgi:alcohol dehydrogenase class IV